MFGQLGHLGQLTKLLKNAGKIKADVAALHERLKAARFEADAGGGQVHATCDGRGELVGIRIAPALVSTGDAEMVEDLIVAAVREATRRSREGAKAEMEAVAAEVGFPGLAAMLDM
jgi:DNA-binding YbaB/EbfC family protein